MTGNLDLPVTGEAGEAGVVVTSTSALSVEEGGEMRGRIYSI